MGLRINQNISAITAHRNLTITDGARGKALERLSSGLRINRAADDAAGLGISEKLRSQIRGLNQAVRNAQDGISLIQTAEGALSETSSVLIRMRELSVQASSESITDTDRTNIKNEIEQLKSEISRIAETTEFNTRKLLDGTIAGTRTEVAAEVEVKTGASMFATNGVTITTGASIVDDTYQVKLVASGSSINAVITSASGATASADGVDGAAVGVTIDGLTITVAQAAESQIGDVAYIKTFAKVDGSTEDASLEFQIGANLGQTTKIGVSAMGASDLGIDNVSVDSTLEAQNAIGQIDRAISTVANERSSLGAVQNRMEHTIANLGTASENLSASESRIRDVDMASEMTKFVRDQIMMQAGVGMLAQANMAPQMILSLLQ